jgi:soluble lytic murein transglycosylase-like protein
MSEKILELTQYDSLIEENANAYHIDKDLVKAMCFVESSFDPWKMRYENHTLKYCITPYEYASKLNITEETERVQQMSSWGLLQTCGFLAREIGFTSNLTKLLDPVYGLDVGCKHIANLLRKYANEEDAVSSYNQGGPYRDSNTGSYKNFKYVDKVSAQLRVLRMLK